MNNSYLEVIGRLGVLLIIAITMNRTQWYQNLTFISSFNIYTFAFSLGFVLGILWVFLPILKVTKQTNLGGKRA